MKTPPPESFEGFCIAFEVALYRDSPGKSNHSVDAYLDGAIDYGLDWCNQDELRTLGDFLKNILNEPDAADQLNALWTNIGPRIAFFSGPDAGLDRPGIVHIFARVLAAIEKNSPDNQA